MDEYVFLADKPIEAYRKSDVGFIACMILLCGIGIFALSMCSQSYAQRMFGSPYYFIKRQLVSMGMGFAGFIIFASLNMKIIRKLLPFFVISVLVLCVLTFVPGISIERNGARRWIQMPFAFTIRVCKICRGAVSCQFIRQAGAN